MSRATLGFSVMMSDFAKRPPVPSGIEIESKLGL